MAVLKLKQTTKLGHSKIWKLDSKKSKQTFGVSRKSNLVSIDKSSSPFEGVFEHRADGWHYISFDIKSDTPDLKIENNSELILKDSKLEFSLIERQAYIQASLENIKSSGTENRKILLVSKNGQLLKTEVKRPADKIFYVIDGFRHNLDFMPTTEWQQKEIDGFTFKSKLIQVEDIKNIGQITQDQIVDKESKRMLYMTLGLMALFLFIGVLTPKKEAPVVEVPIKTSQNVVVRMNKKSIEKRKQSKAPKETTQPKQANNAQGSRVNAMLKGAIGARISQLIGKVSATDARTENVLVTTSGKRADSGATGRALAAVGKVESSGRNWTGEAVGGKAGVSTGGVASGRGTDGLGNGLNAGKTGSGGVGLIEEESEVTGGLDREIIAQYIKSQLGQILYCYERQLSVSPELYGKVAVKFTIAGTGLVESQLIGDTTLKSQPVEGCILNKVSKWKFPEPKGGTKVVVTYPFLFKSTN
jgi:outer membrane biosynthesis protein TonB